MNNNKKRPTCYIYCRTATDKNKKQVNSLDYQKNKCLEYIKENNLTVKGIYYDSGKSGLSLSRPGFWQLVDRLEKYKVDTVLISDISRLGRNISFPEQRIITAIGPDTKIITTEKSEEKFTKIILMAFENYRLTKELK